MTDKARELLDRAVEWIEAQQEPRMLGANDIIKEIRTYLAEPEVKREPLSGGEINYIYFNKVALGGTYLTAFKFGFREAEKHHGIGGGDE